MLLDNQLASASLDALLDAAVNAIIIIDATGHIETFNLAAEAIFGYTAAETAGQNIKMLMPQPYRDEHDGYLTNYRETGKARIIGIGREVFAQRKNGSTFPIDLSVGLIKGEPTRFVGIILDLSERNAAREETRQQRERLAHVARLSTMGEMAAGIAHEVNQPLSAISTYANACERMLRSGTSEPEELLQILVKIAAQAQRAGSVIHRLRRFVRKRESERDDAELNALCREVLSLAEVDASAHNTHLSLKLTPDPLVIFADSVQIQQVVLNLVRNAMEAMETEKARVRGVTVALKSTDADQALIEVIDYGSGLNDDARRELFSPFFTTKSSGLGMGLSISQSIINSHGGSLQYADGADGATVFRVLLPLSNG